MQVGRGRHVAAAGEGDEGIRPVRGLVMPGPVLPHPPALIPLLAVRPKPPQPQLASPLVELAPGKGGARCRDRLPWASRRRSTAVATSVLIANPRAAIAASQTEGRTESCPGQHQ